MHTHARAQGELTVLLREGRDLPVWGMPWQSNPWVRLALGEQAVASRRDSETSTESRHGAPVWNQEVQFLVEDPEKQVCVVSVRVWVGGVGTVVSEEGGGRLSTLWILRRLWA